MHPTCFGLATQSTRRKHTAIPNPMSKILTLEIAQKFLKNPHGVSLDFFTSIDEVAAQALAEYNRWLSLTGLTSLSDAAAQALARHKGTLDLSGLKSLSDSPGHSALAKKLAQDEGTLVLAGLTTMSDSVAQALAQHNGILNLSSLTSLSEAAAKALAQHDGDLVLSGLTSLSEAAAQALAQRKGDLWLHSLESLSEAIALALAKHKGNLSLWGLANLSEAAAQALAQHKGALSLYGLKSLSDAAALALAQHEGEISLNGQAKKVLERAHARLRHTARSVVASSATGAKLRDPAAKPDVAVLLREMKTEQEEELAFVHGGVELSHADRMAMLRAQGWLELKLPLEANEELDEIQPQLRAHPEVLKLRYQVYADTKQWPMAYKIASTLNREFPQDAFGGVHAAMALYRMGLTRDAKEHSLNVAERFPKDWSVRYNLIIYCTQLQELDAAKEWFKAAVELNERVKRMALGDFDLEPFWQALIDAG